MDHGIQRELFMFHGKYLSKSATFMAQVLSEMHQAALRGFFPTSVVLVNPQMQCLFGAAYLVGDRTKEMFTF